MALMDDEPVHRSMIPTFCVFFLVLEIVMALFTYFTVGPAMLPIYLFYITMPLGVIFVVLVCFNAFIRSIPAKSRQSDLPGPPGYGAFFIRIQD